MAKIINSTDKGAAIDEAENTANLSTVAGINAADANASMTVDVDDQGVTIEYTNGGAVAVTLSDIADIYAAGVGNLHTDDFTVTLLASGTGTVVTITPDGTDSFNTGVSTIVLRKDDYITLQTDSTGAVWNIINRAPRRVLLSDQTASASATIDFTGIPADYDFYIVEIDDVFPVTGSAHLQVRFFESGAWQSGASDYYSENGTGSELTIASTMAEDGNAVGWSGARGECRFQMKTANSSASLDSDINYLTITGLTWTNQRQTGGIIAANVVSGIRFFMSSGNISVGNFRLYGIRR